MLIDTFGRQITYLRISLTDRCNLRCVYCMPPEGLEWQSRRDLLTSDEIIKVVRAAAREGIRRVRLTGGEPLIRQDIIELVSQIAGTPGVEEVSLTTNGMLLARKAMSLAEAGLTRVNISLDTIDPERFRRITRGGDIESVFEGIAAAEKAGLAPIKINSVIVRGLNDDELLSLARLSMDHPWHVRFIELMPVGNAQDWGPGFPAADQRYFSVSEMRTRLATLNMKPATPPTGNGPARTFRIPGALGTIGLISPVGDHFCKGCNRLRLTADGALRPCLLLDVEIPIREALRAGNNLAHYIAQAVSLKPQGHELCWQHYPETRRMAQIGG